MKTTKQMVELYNSIKNKDIYYSFDAFVEEAKEFAKQVKSEKLELEVKVSGKGMTRHFISESGKMNRFLDCVYNGRMTGKSRDYALVKGCGMDMHFKLLFDVCDKIFTEKEIEKFDLNRKSSQNPVFKIVRGERVYL